jgi:putative nucleotidyltransferase with HDIG domain
MTLQQIQQIEKEVEKMFLQHKKIHKHEFWLVHVKPTIDLSKKLAKKYHADLKIVWLSAIFHDYGRLNDQKNHEQVGATFAYNYLSKISKNLAKMVSETILPHSCKKLVAKSLEQKILATADALSHFHEPFIFWWFHLNQDLDFPTKINVYLAKMKRDYQAKMFFPEEKMKIKNQYVLIKNLLKKYEK